MVSKSSLLTREIASLPLISPILDLGTVGITNVYLNPG